MDLVMKKFEVYLVNLDPTIGKEIKKIRPAVIVSPDEMNETLSTIIIAPMTTTIRAWPTRVKIKFQGKEGEVALDQIRTIDEERIVKKLGKVSAETQVKITKVLQEMFS
jgi:mRNA interferase MazF